MGLDVKKIDSQAYRALEDVVGPEYVSQEPATLDSYSFGFGLDAVIGSKFADRPLAVTLPGSTEDVQGIVRVCNRFNIPFKAICSGFGHLGLHGKERFVCIDLRRMNRVLKVDEKNMYAVFEPYTSFAALTNAAIKKGLRPYVIGGGPSCCPMANVTNLWGYGTTNVSAGFGGRVPLGAEWVLPNGEILHMGTLGAINEWWSGDGPGPSLRGIMRGETGPAGGLGVFTKLAIKLVPWYGPPKLETYGEPPMYKVKLPKEISSHTMVFPSRDSLGEALQLIQEEGIAYWCSRRGPFSTAAARTSSNQELLSMWQTGEFQKMQASFNDNLSVGLDASTPMELEFKQHCLEKILEKTGGKRLPEGNEDSETAKFVHAFNGLGAVKGCFRTGGGMTSQPNLEESITSVIKAVDEGVEIKDKYSKAGVFLDDGDSTWITPLEDFGYHMEIPARYDPTDEASVKGCTDFVTEAEREFENRNISIGGFGLCWQKERHDVVGPKTMDYQKWVRKVKKLLDPNLVSESFFYPKMKEKK
jgi:glycolate oxidase